MAEFRTVPRIWDGGTCFILGGGPSLGMIALESLRGRRCIAVNEAFEDAPWAEVMFYGDLKFLRKRRRERLRDFAGLKVTSIERHIDEVGINVVRRDRTTYGISEDPTTLVWNLNSGASAMNLAYLLGSRRLVLLGFDMKRVDGRSNYHDRYDAEDTADDRALATFVEPFQAVERDLKRLGCSVVLATPGSALAGAVSWPVVYPAELGITMKEGVSA